MARLGTRTTVPGVNIVDERSVIVWTMYAGRALAVHHVVLDPRDLAAMEGAYVVGRVAARTQMDVIGTGGDVRILERTKEALSAICSARSNVRAIELVPVSRISMTRTARPMKDLGTAPRENQPDNSGPLDSYGPLGGTSRVQFTAGLSEEQIAAAALLGDDISNVTVVPKYIVYRTHADTMDPLALVDLYELVSILLKHVYGKTAMAKNTRSVLDRLLEQIMPKAEAALVNQTAFEANRSPAMDAYQALAQLMSCETELKMTTWAFTEDPRLQAIARNPESMRFSASERLTNADGIAKVIKHIKENFAELQVPVDALGPLDTLAQKEKRVIDKYATGVLYLESLREAIKMVNQAIFTTKDQLLINWEGRREDFIIAIDLIRALECVLDILPQLNDLNWSYAADSVEIKEQTGWAKFVAKLSYEAVYYARRPVLQAGRMYDSGVGKLPLSSLKSAKQEMAAGPAIMASNKQVSFFGPRLILKRREESSWFTNAGLDKAALTLKVIHMDCNAAVFRDFMELMQTRTATGLTMYKGPIAGMAWGPTIHSLPENVAARLPTDNAIFLPIAMDTILGTPLYDEIRPYQHIQLVEQPGYLEVMGTIVLPKHSIRSATQRQDAVELPATDNTMITLQKGTIPMPVDWRYE